MDWKEHIIPQWLDDDESWESDSGIASGHACSTPTEMSPTEGFWEDLTVDTDFYSGQVCLQQPLPTPVNEYEAEWMEFVQGVAEEDSTEEQLRHLLGQHYLAVLKRVLLGLHEDDPLTVNKMAAYLFEVARCSENVPLLVRCVDLMTDLGQCVDLWPICGEHPEIGHCVSGIVYYLSQTEPGLEVITLSGNETGVSLIVNFMQSDLESVLYYAVTALHNVLLYREATKEIVRSLGGVERLVGLLGRISNTKFLAICTDCLQLLAYSHPETKLAVLKYGGVPAVVRILAEINYEKLLWTAIRLLKVLSVCPANKKAILADPRTLVALTRCLGFDLSGRLRRNTLWTLRNLSDLAVRSANPPPTRLLEALVECLRTSGSEEVGLAGCVAGILANFTCRNEHIKTLVVQLGVVPALLGVISAQATAGSLNDLLEPAFCCLRHVTSSHPLAPAAVHALLSFAEAGPLLTNGVLAGTVDVSHWCVRRAWLGLVRNLAADEVGREMMLAHPRTLVDGLVDVSAAVVERLEWTLVDKKGNSYVRLRDSSGDVEVDLTQLMDTCCVTLSLLARPDPMPLLHVMTSRVPGLFPGLVRLFLTHSSGGACSGPLLTALVDLTGHYPAAAARAILLAVGTWSRPLLADRLEAVARCQCVEACPATTWAANLIGALAVEAEICDQLDRTRLLPESHAQTMTPLS